MNFKRRKSVVKSCKFKLTLTVIVLLLAVMLCAVPVGAEGSRYAVSFPVTMSNPKRNMPDDTMFTLVIPIPTNSSPLRSKTDRFSPTAKSASTCPEGVPISIIPTF